MIQQIQPVQLPDGRSTEMYKNLLKDIAESMNFSLILRESECLLYMSMKEKSGYFQKAVLADIDLVEWKVSGDEIVPIEPADFDKATEANKDMAGRAMRV